jgi:hypothetical protein
VGGRVCSDAAGGQRGRPSLVRRARAGDWPGDPKVPPPVAPVQGSTQSRVCATGLVPCPCADHGEGGPDGGAVPALRRAGRAQAARGRLRAADRPGRAGAQGDPLVRDVDRPVVGAGGLAGRAGGHPGRDGVDRGVLGAGLEPAGGAVRAGAGQRAVHQGGPGAQDRRQGQRVDRRPAAARAGEAELRAGAAAAGAARADPLSQQPGRGAGARGQPHPEDAGGGQHQAGLGRLRRAGGPRGAPCCSG